jgi:hypothetical protein
MTKRISAHYIVAKFLRSEESKKFKLRLPDALILRVIADYIDMRKASGVCFAFQKTLAAECKYSERRISSRLAVLSKLKLILRKKRGKSYHYFLGETLTSFSDSLSHKKTISVQFGMQSPDNLSGYNQTNCPMIIDIEKHNKREDINITETTFDLFWEIYPYKIKKKEAKDTWSHRKLDGIADMIISDVKTRIAKDERWQNKKFIPSPAKYLSGDRWTDEIMEKTNEKYQGTDKLNHRQTALQSYIEDINQLNKH